MTAARDTRKRASAGRASATLPNLEPEAVWTNRVLRFEADALSRFFEQTFDAVYGVVGAAAVDEAQAEDVVARTYVAFLDALPGLRTASLDLTGALLGLAVAQLPAVPESGAPSSAGVSPAKAAVASLTEVQRSTLLLRLRAGMDPNQIGSATSRRLGAVLTAQGSGLEAVRRALDPSRGHAAELGGPDPRLVDEAVSRLLVGASATSAAHDLPSTQLIGLMQAADQVRMLPLPPVDPAGRLRGKELFLEEAGRRRVTWVHSHSLPHRSRPVHRPGSGGRTFGLAFIAVVAILAGAVASALANFSEPDSIFYPAKRAGESVLMATTGDSVARATLETQLSEQRLREAEAMAAAGRGDLVVSAISDHYQYLRDAANDLSSASVSHVGKWLLARDALVQEESQSVTAISQKLKDDKDLVAGNQVDRYSTQFQDDRKTLDPPLQTAVPSPAASPSPASG